MCKNTNTVCDSCRITYPVTTLCEMGIKGIICINKEIFGPCPDSNYRVHVSTSGSEMTVITTPTKMPEVLSRTVSFGKKGSVSRVLDFSEAVIPIAPGHTTPFALVFGLIPTETVPIERCAACDQAAARNVTK
jgi:hypothetical protein